MGLFGSRDDKVIKKLMKQVEQINEIEKEYTNLSKEELQGKTIEFKERIKEGETLDEILPEAFAAVKVAATRAVGETPYDVQILGAIVLHQGRIAELKTGEGKTLMSTMAGYLNALSGKGVHLVTVNEYLAKHQSEWMGKIYSYLGITVGLIGRGQNTKQKQAAYNADITYGISSEYGFDYLRDSGAMIKQSVVQRELNYVMIDEIDSILIDEARSPLIISDSSGGKMKQYGKANSFIKTLKARPEAPPTDKFAEYDENDPKYHGDYDADEKGNTAALTEEGVTKAEKYFGVNNLSDIENIEISHSINQALHAHALMHRDKDYVIKDRQVIIVDKNTGRLRPGRRFSDGLHQAIEAKENVPIQRESKTISSITLQNYFRMYDKVSGMTATAKTEEEEFRTIYGMDVVVIPTNKPVIRIDEEDSIYTTEKYKFNAIIENIKECQKTGQPVLVGTASVEASETLSKMLKKQRIVHDVLNAKNHEREAEIVSQAGRLNRITIATNMAGRGTDIKLGGDSSTMATNDLLREKFTTDEILIAAGHTKITDEKLIALREKYNQLVADHKKVTDEEKKKVIELGGLRVIGSERHDSRRIDNQLRGRSGRQGDPGSSKFFISFDDKVTRLYTKDNSTILNMVKSIEMEDGFLGQHKMITNTIQRAQKAAESRSFSIRKNILQYDNIINDHRKIIYSQRREVLNKEDNQATILTMIKYYVDDMVSVATAESEYPEEWDIDKILAFANSVFLVPFSKVKAMGQKKVRILPQKYKIDINEAEREDLTREKFKEILLAGAMRVYNDMNDEFTKAGLNLRDAESALLLRVVTAHWQHYNEAVEQVKQGIGLRSVGQRDPIVEFRIEAGQMFDDAIHKIKIATASNIFTSNMKRHLDIKKYSEEAYSNMTLSGEAPAKEDTPVVKKKVGRNDPCPCGKMRTLSDGRKVPMKYKNCCGKK